MVTFIIIYVFFETTLLLCKPLSKLDLPTLRHGSKEERTWQNRLKSNLSVSPLPLRKATHVVEIFLGCIIFFPYIRLICHFSYFVL